MFLFEGTVRNHLSAAIGKTGATNPAEAVRIAEENGWLERRLRNHTERAPGHTS